mgnify:FL=1
MKDEMFYWFDDGDNFTVGPFTTSAAAREDAKHCAGIDGNHKRRYTFVEVVAQSAPPSLKRRWKVA